MLLFKYLTAITGFSSLMLIGSALCCYIVADMDPMVERMFEVAISLLLVTVGLAFATASTEGEEQ